MKEPDSLPGRIQKLVEILGSQRALARLADVRDGTVIGWLGGSQPYEKTLRKMADRLGVSIDWLRTGKGNEQHELQTVRETLERSAGRVAEDGPEYGDDATTIHDSLDFIRRHGSREDVRMVEDILLAARRRIADRKARD